MSEIERAQARTARAKLQLAAALGELKTRLLPRTLARNLVAATRAKAVDAASAGADAVRGRPAVAVGAAALAALFFARKPIGRAISKDISADGPET